MRGILALMGFLFIGLMMEITLRVLGSAVPTWVFTHFGTALGISFVCFICSLNENLGGPDDE